MTSTRRIVILLAAALAIGGCGGGDDTEGKTDAKATATVSPAATLDENGGDPSTLALTDDLIAPSNLKIGQFRGDVRKAFGPPYIENTDRGESCDVYQLANAAIEAEVRYIHLCYDKKRTIDVITSPYDPFAKKLKPPSKKHKLKPNG